MLAIDFPASPYIASAATGAMPSSAATASMDLLRHVEIGRPAGDEVRPDIVFVVPLRFLARESVQEPGNVIDCSAWFFDEQLQRALIGTRQGLQGGAVQRNMGGVDHDADSGDLEVVADPGQHMESFFCRHLFGRKGAADVGGVDGSVPQASQIHLIVTGMPHDAFQVFVGVQTVLAQDDPGERTRRVGRAVHGEPPPA